MELGFFSCNYVNRVHEKNGKVKGSRNEHEGILCYEKKMGPYSLHVTTRNRCTQAVPWNTTTSCLSYGLPQLNSYSDRARGEREDISDPIKGFHYGIP